MGVDRRGLGWAGGRHSRSLEEEHPPVGRAQVEDVGPLAVVTGASGQRVVDADGILQLRLRQGLPRLVLLLWGVPFCCGHSQSPSLALPSPAALP